MGKVICNWFAICTSGAAIGLYAWRGDTGSLALLPILVWIWCNCSTRGQAFSALLSYYLAASRGLMQGANIYFGDPTGEPVVWIGIVVWITPNLILAGIWAMFWGKERLPLRVALLLPALVLPPIGIIGWANPLTAAGVLFPALGWAGLAMTFMLLICLAQAPRPALLAPFFAASLCANAAHRPVAPPENWIGIDTRIGAGADATLEYDRMMHLQNLVAKASQVVGEDGLILLPEMVAGNWTVNGPWWERIQALAARRRQIILIGAYRPLPTGGYVNLLVSLGIAPGQEMVDRMPSPISMWRPWSSNSARAFFLDTGVKKVAGLHIAPLICYEQLLIWPVLVSVWHRPDLLVAPSNRWWARNNSIPGIQSEAVTAWGRLFGLPVLGASNY